MQICEMNQKACILTPELWIKPQTLKLFVTPNIQDHTESLLKSQFPVISLWRKKSHLVFLDSCDWMLWLIINVPLNSIWQSKQIPEC